MLIGSKLEVEYTREISSNFDDKRLVDLAGQTTLDELITIIANANLMVTNDTGPMHLAFSTNIPVICLFGPCSPEQYGINKNAFSVYKPLYCSPCVHDFETPPCKGNNSCMKLISCSEVANLVNYVLLDQIDKSTNNIKDFIYEYEGEILGMVNR